MRFIRKLLRLGVSGLVGATISALVGVVLLSYPFGRGLVYLSYDFPYIAHWIKPHKPTTDVMIVYLDETSTVELGQNFLGGWDRHIHARMLERLKADGARSATFDIIFSDPSDNATNNKPDEHFVAAIKDFGKVILGADSAKSAQGRVGGGGSEINPPYEPFMDATKDLGLAEMLPDEDLVPRRHIPIDPTGFYHPMSFATALLLDAPISQKTNIWTEQRWINYYGPPGYIPSIGYSRIFDTNDVPPGFFREKAVFIGSRTLTKTAGERKDEYPAPYAKWLDTGNKFMPGVEIQATMFCNLMENNWLTRIPKWTEFSIILFTGILFGIGMMGLRPLYALMIALVSTLLIALMSYLLVSQTFYWFAWVIVICEIGVATIWSIVFNGMNYFAQQKVLSHSVSMYVSPARVKQIMKSQDEFMKPGAVKQEVSILFSDIANFTSMSEGMDTDDLATMMNSYFENAVNNCINKTDGTVVKYIGDAIFALWNAPEPQKDHHTLACQGGIYMRDNVTDFKFKNPKPGLEVRTRIGLHCGLANVGNFGSSTRVDYTALGENINLAARMEGLNKYIGTSVVITGDLEEKVRGKFITRFIGKFILKGFGKPVDVFELLTTPEKAEESRPWREAFNEAQKKFWARDWDGATAAFKQILEIKPKDGPSTFFIKHIEDLKSDPPSPEWKGEIEMHEK